MNLTTPLNPQGLLVARDAVSLGPDARSLQRSAARGELLRLARGVYTTPDHWAALARREQHILRCRAAAARLGPSLVLAGPSAAAVLGLDLATPWPDAVCALSTPADGTRRRGGMAWWAHPSHDLHVQDLGWARATDPFRTAAEIAARTPFVAGLICADSALRQLGHRGPGQGGERIQKVARELRIHRGARRVERIAVFADGDSESAGESWTRAVLAHLGAPPPQLQVDIVDGALWLARVDFCWPERRIVVEFDGEKKYRAALRAPGRSVEDVVIEEKKREDRLRAAGWTVVRLVWDDLRAPERLRAVLRRVGLVS